MALSHEIKVVQAYRPIPSGFHGSDYELIQE